MQQHRQQRSSRRSPLRTPRSLSLRMQMRKKPRRHGPKPEPARLTRLLKRPDHTHVIRLPIRIWADMGLRRGSRIWFHVQGKALHITKYPWGPNPGRRYSTRLRNCHDSILGRWEK